MTVTAFVPKGQRTPRAWRRACLEILQAEVHAKYGCNQNVGGRYIELSRRDENGLHLSYNLSAFEKSTISALACCSVSNRRLTL